MIDFSDEYYYDPKSANRAIGFIEKYVTHVKGELAGKLIKLEKWQKEDILKPVFGIKRKKDGLRRFRTVYIEIPRKNAKSTLGAAIALYLLLSDGELGAEIYSAAGDALQARIIFEIAQGMVHQSPELASRCKTFQHSIKKENSMSFYKVISSESKTKYGFNTHGVLFDELFVQPDRELWDTFDTSMGSRRQPLMFAITTAGWDKDSICYEIHDKAKKIKDGILIEDEFLPVIYTAPEDADIFNEQIWKLANPGYGSIVKAEYIKSQANKVKSQPGFESAFRRLHLNQWVGTADTWMPDDKWMRGAIKFEPEPGDKSFWGLDLGVNRDLSALVGIFPKEWGIGVKCYFYVPSETVSERSRGENNNYESWVSKEYITVTPGESTDYDFIKRDIFKIIETYSVMGIAYDRAYASQLIHSLQKEGIKEELLDPFGQGYISMNAPIKELEKMILDGKIHHSGNPVLRWMCSNIDMKFDAHENASFQKRHQKNRIDGMVALAMAVGEWMTTEPVPRSRYEDNPELTVL